MNTNNKKSFPIKFRSEVFLWTAVGVAAFVFGFYFYNFHGKLITTTNGEWGTFGDFIGGTLNPFFSFLSFIALLTTINLQRKELKASRKELKASTKQLKRTANAQEMAQKALDKQLQTQSKQQFENTFFSLLDQHNQILEANEEKFRSIYTEVLSASGTYGLDHSKKNLQSHNQKCGHYFRVLYQLLKFIATNHPGSVISEDFSKAEIQNSPVPSNEKMYSNIVRAFLDYKLTQLLAINCYCDTDDNTNLKFKLVVERYALLEHMPFTYVGAEYFPDVMLKTREHYDDRAFGNSEFVKTLPSYLTRSNSDQSPV